MRAGHGMLVVSIAVDDLGREGGICQCRAGECAQQFGIGAFPQVHVRSSIALVAHVDGVVIGRVCLIGLGVGTADDATAAVSEITVARLQGQVSSLGGAAGILVEEDVQRLVIGRQGDVIVGVAVDRGRGHIRQLRAAPSAQSLMVLSIPTVSVHVAHILIARVAHIDVEGINRIFGKERGHGIDCMSAAVEGKLHIVATNRRCRQSLCNRSWCLP